MRTDKSLLVDDPCVVRTLGDYRLWSTRPRGRGNHFKAQNAHLTVAFPNDYAISSEYHHLLVLRRLFLNLRCELCKILKFQNQKDGRWLVSWSFYSSRISISGYDDGMRVGGLSSGLAVILNGEDGKEGSSKTHLVSYCDDFGDQPVERALEHIFDLPNKSVGPLPGPVDSDLVRSIIKNEFSNFI
ncbi:hypothetical protein GH714_019790 [Hevea brasiliensis]|uniref:E3 ubiquitin-protein ligase RKP N-terminal domain-containing protein n=1 Tax=Hevea brasiliensis TaxID=3981 RepID=A0A6A6K7W8_HEVBR|nr:hypothetical protein GH714_019790 [Hevea brasiliensis]